MSQAVERLGEMLWQAALLQLEVVEEMIPKKAEVRFWLLFVGSVGDAQDCFFLFEIRVCEIVETCWFGRFFFWKTKFDFTVQAPLRIADPCHDRYLRRHWRKLQKTEKIVSQPEIPKRKDWRQ